jgi:hypothetical protein
VEHVKFVEGEQVVVLLGYAIVVHVILKEDLFSTWPIERELEELKKASIAPDSQSLSEPGNA